MTTIARMMIGAAGILWLAGTAAAADTAVVAQPANADDGRIICKKSLDTGSLVRKTKQCYTKAEWDRISESQRTGAQKMVQDLTTKQGGN